MTDLHAQMPATNGPVGAPTAASTTAPAIEKSGGNCEETLVQSMGTTDAIVGQGYITTSGWTAAFTYSQGATSELGVGFSSSGDWGTYSQNGTSSWSANGTQGFAPIGDYTSRWWGTDFSVGKYEVDCLDAYVGWYFLGYNVESNGWAGGDASKSPSSVPTANYCVSEAPGDYFQLTTTTAVTWTDGFDLSPFIGLSVSAVTGYSSTASIRFDSSAYRDLCGTGAYPGMGTVYQLVGNA